MPLAFSSYLQCSVAAICLYLGPFTTACAQHMPSMAFLRTGTFTLCVPSTDCVNCKAASANVFSKIADLHLFKDVTAITDNDAGAYYFVKNANLYKEIDVQVAPLQSSTLSPNGRSSINFSSATSNVTLELRYGLDSLLTMLAVAERELFDGKCNKLSTDTTILDYEVFTDYSNFIFEAHDQLFLYSSSQDIAIRLFVRNRGEKAETSKLIEPSISAAKYDSLSLEFACNKYSNMTFEQLKKFSAATAIPFIKFYGATQYGMNNFICGRFFSGNNDTVSTITIGANSDTTINLKVAAKFKNQVGIYDCPKREISSPVDFSNYSLSLQIPDSIAVNKINYRYRASAEFCVDSKYFYLPVARTIGQDQTLDSLYYILKIRRGANIAATDSEVLFYDQGHFGELCLLRTGYTQPILVNKIKEVIDFGEGQRKLHWRDLQIKSSSTDKVTMVYDICNSGVNRYRIAFVTNNGKLMVGSLTLNGELIDTQELQSSATAIHCQFLSNNIFVVVSRLGKRLVLDKYSF
jgi:hypothetical protein